MSGRMGLFDAHTAPQKWTKPKQEKDKAPLRRINTDWLGGDGGGTDSSPRRKKLSDASWMKDRMAAFQASPPEDSRKEPTKETKTKDIPSHSHVDEEGDHDHKNALVPEENATSEHEADDGATETTQPSEGHEEDDEEDEDQQEQKGEPAEHRHEEKVKHDEEEAVEEDQSHGKDDHEDNDHKQAATTSSTTKPTEAASSPTIEHISVPRNEGFLGGDSRDMFGLKETKKWTKPKPKQEVNHNGHLNNDWLGGGGGGGSSSPRRWRPPPKKDEHEESIDKKKHDDTKPTTSGAATTTATHKVEADSKKQGALSHIEVPRNEGFLGGDSRDMFGLKEIKKWTKPKPKKEVNHNGHLNNDWLGGGGGSSSPRRWRPPPKTTGEPSTLSPMSSPPSLPKHRPTASSPTKENAKESRSNESSESSAQEKVETEQPASNAREEHNKEEALASREVKVDVHVPKTEGFLGGDNHAMFGIPKETKKWTKPKPKDTNKPLSPTRHLNNDWLGGGAETSPRRFRVPSPQKEEPKPTTTAVPEKQKDALEISEESKKAEVAAHKEEDNAQPSHKVSMDLRAPRVDGFLGGDSRSMFGIPTETKKWTKPKKKTRDNHSNSKLNNDWLGASW